MNRLFLSWWLEALLISSFLALHIYQKDYIKFHFIKSALVNMSVICSLRRRLQALLLYRDHHDSQGSVARSNRCLRIVEMRHFIVAHDVAFHIFGRLVLLFIL